MPHTPPERITQRPQINSNASANVPLQVNERITTGGSGAMWGVVNALSRFAGGYAASRREKQRVSDRKDLQKGQQAADAAAVTGKPTAGLEEESAWFKRGYHETEGLLASQEFVRWVSPKLAALEPDADIDHSMQEWTEEYLKDKAPADPTARGVLMHGLAQSQAKLKQQFEVHSTGEMLKRQEENLGAIVTQGILDGSLLEDGGMRSVYKLAERPEYGLHPREVDQIVTNAAAASMADGSSDPAKVLSVLRRTRPDGTPSLYSIPKYREVLDAAARRGETVLAQKKKQEQVGAETSALNRLNDLADRGMLTDGMVSKDGDQFGWTAQARAALHNRNREAQERLAKKAKAADKKLEALRAFNSGNPIQVALVGNEKVAAAANKQMAEAYKNGDMSLFNKTIKQSERLGIDNKFLQNMFAQFDPAHPQAAEKLLNLRDKLDGESRSYLDKSLKSKTKAAMDHYDTLVNDLGESPAQALSTIASTESIADSKAVTSAVNKVDLDDHIPDTLEDRDILHGKFTNTDAKNLVQVRNTIRNMTAELYASGHYKDADAAADAAATMFKARHVGIDGRWVPSRGVSQQDVPAISHIQGSIRDTLVKHGALDKNDDAYLYPTPNDPGRWIMLHGTGPTRAVLDGSGEPVMVPIKRALSSYAEWHDRQSNSRIARSQALRKLGLDTEDTSDAGLDRLASGIRSGSVRHTRSVGRVAVPEQIGSKAADQVEALKSEAPEQSFIDYLHSQP